jgi:hypothetical protein
VYAQPLYVPDLTINGAVHDGAFAAPGNDTDHALYADQTSAVAPLWETNLSPSGAA